MKLTPKPLTSLLFAALGLISVSACADAEDAEKNLHKLNVPDGFKVEVYAEVPDARLRALGQSTGTLFVGTR